MGFSPDAKGKPVFNDTADPQADLQAGVDYAARVGNTVVGTSAERVAMSSGALWDGLTFVETDTGVRYTRIGGGWQREPRIAKGTVAVSGMVQNATKVVTVSLPSGMFTAAPEIALTPITTAPHVVSLGTGSRSTTEFAIYVRRTDTNTEMTISWMAIQ